VPQAGKAYILPRIIERAEDHEARRFLQSLLPRMLAPDPAARPSYAALKRAASARVKE